jgi:hypothetical protein
MVMMEMRQKELIDELNRQLGGLAEVVIGMFQQLAPEEPLPQ